MPHPVDAHAPPSPLRQLASRLLHVLGAGVTLSTFGATPACLGAEVVDQRQACTSVDAAGTCPSQSEYAAQMRAQGWDSLESVDQGPERFGATQCCYVVSVSEQGRLSKELAKINPFKKAEPVDGRPLFVDDELRVASLRRACADDTWCQASPPRDA